MKNNRLGSMKCVAMWLAFGTVLGCGTTANASEKTRWIRSDNLNERSPLMRSAFQVKPGLKMATAKVSAVGYVEFYLNGKKANQDLLFPDPTQYEKRILFRTYDVTRQLQQGRNGVGLWLNEGQAAYTIPDKKRFFNKIRKAPGPYPAPAGWLELVLEYRDGTVETVRTDETWKTASGPLTYANFYGGENYDARLEKTGWSSASYDDAKWANAVKAEVKAELSESLIPAARVMDVIDPVASRKPSPGVFLYDLGQNIGGWWRITVRGKPGTVLTIRGAETLDNRLGEDGFANAKRVSDKPAHSGNRYAWDATTVYTLKGGGDEQYEPRFFYTGFRYVDISTDDPAAIEKLEVQGCAVHNEVAWLGDFRCSDERLNRLHKNTAWSIKSILQGAPMSNPHSEKYGWTGDVHLFAEAADSLFDMDGVWRQWLQNLRDSQEVVGGGQYIPDTVPNYRIKDAPAHSIWGATYPLAAWYLYRHSGDKSVYEEYYEPLRSWGDFLQSTAKGGLVSGMYADHCAPLPMKYGNSRLYTTPNLREILGTSYYILTEQILAEMAQVLGKDEAVRLHNERIQTAQTALNAKYFKNAAYRAVPDKPGHDPLQTANLVPLQMGLEPAGSRSAILETVYKNIEQKNRRHLRTGIVGTKALIKVLVREGKGDLLYDVVTNPTYPGWGYWLKKGATTQWQKWNGTGDHNHAMFGSVSDFLTQGIAGIIPPTEPGTSVGWKTVRISPLILSKLDWAEGKVPTPHGLVSSRWEKKNDSVLITVTLPGSVTGELVLGEGITAPLCSGQNRYKLTAGKLKRQ